MLRQKARSAVVWSAVDLFMRQGMGFAFAIALARLLVPEDFGTIALLSLFLGLAGLFVNAGFSTALIQKQDTTHVDESTVFWFNMGAGVIFTLALIGFAPWMADFFALPVLSPLAMAMALNVLISAMGSIHGTLMTKRLDFRTPMKIGVIATLFSGGVGVYMAWAGYGVWALAGQALTSTLIGTALLWFFSPWRPLLTFSSDSFRGLFAFSGYIFAAELLQMFHQNGYSVLIGKFFGVRDLGFYNRANTTQRMIVGFPTGIVSRVTFPLYSSINKDAERLRRAVRMSIRSIMLVTSPLMFGLAVLAEPFIHVVFGEQWLPAAPIMQVLCFAGLFLPMHDVNVSVLKAQGHAKLNLRISLIKKATGVTFLVAGSFYGVMGVAWASVIQSIVVLMINGFYTKKFLNYGMREQIQDCIPAFLLSALMAALVALAGYWVEIGGMPELLMLVILGASFYGLSNLVLGHDAFTEAVAFIRGGEHLK